MAQRKISLHIDIDICDTNLPLLGAGTEQHNMMLLMKRAIGLSIPCELIT